MNLETRITHNPLQCGGKPCIRGMRIRVSDILQMLGEGVNSEEILSDFPDLEQQDIQACLYTQRDVRIWNGWWHDLLVDAQLPPQQTSWLSERFSGSLRFTRFAVARCRRFHDISGGATRRSRHQQQGHRFC